MGIRCVCDVCGNEIRPTQLGAPVGWASISVTFPTKLVSGKLPLVPPGPPDYYLICSGTCVEKALDEVKAHMVKAFGAKTEYQED